MKLKLKQSIYILIFLCSFVPVGIWILFSVYDSEQRIERIVRENIEAIGGSQTMSIQDFCEGRKESMETISRMALVREAIKQYSSEGHSEELDEFLKENEKQKTYIASISVVDVNFDVIGSSQKYDVLGSSDFQYSEDKYKTGLFSIGNTYERETDSGLKLIIPAYIGIYEDEKLIGYLIEEIDCSYFNRLRLQTDFLEDGTLYLLDGKNNIITAGTAKETESRDDLISSEEELENYYKAWNAFDHDKYNEGVIYYEYNNQKYMTYFADINYSDWSIRITENLSAQWKSNQSAYILIVLEGIAVAALLVFAQILLAKKLISPLNRIVQTLKDVQYNHDYTLRTGVIREDEVGVVAKGIDELLEYIEIEELEEKRRHREFAERANAEAQALQHKEFLSESMLSNMPSGYHRCLPDEEKGFPFLQLGSHIEEILGWTAEEIKNELGNCYRNLIWPEDLDVVLKYVDMVAKVGSGNSYDTSVYRMKHKDGGFRWITDATMFVDLGEESFFQGVIADITPYVEGMEEAKQLAEASSHAKTDFLSQMSHDIRTPMNAIIGFTNLAKKAEDIMAVQGEYIPKIETASNQLLMIINDVLEMNSIEKGKIIFNNVPCDIVKLVDDIMTVMKLQAEEKGVELIFDVNVTDRYIYCDESRFSRVFTNLMSNAIKFTPSGGKVSVTIEQKDENIYIFKIADTGIGMSPDFAPRVFEPFERERTSTVSRVEGTGLGMAIVKSIVDAAGGTISVESEQGKGTVFTIEVPMMIVEKNAIEELVENFNAKSDAEKVATALISFEGRRVLLVEDNEFNRNIAEVVLEDVDFTVETAEDGHIAVEMVKNAPSEDYYDVILMDIQMPTMNGYEATRAIREMEDSRAETVIIAVTANALENDKNSAREAGMDGHISKPIDVEILYSTLSEILK